MADRFAPEALEQQQPSLLLPVLILMIGVGFAVLLTASFPHADRLTGDPFYFARAQLINLFIGLLFASLIYSLNTDALRRLLPMLMIGSFLLLVLTFVPGIGGILNGGRRWIFLFGRTFQPSETAKFVLILYVAHMLDKNYDRIDDLVYGILPTLIVSVSFITIVYLQNDFSTTFFFVFIIFVLFFVARTPVSYFLYLTTASTALSLIFLFTEPHRVERVKAFLRPELDPQGISYQLNASIAALSRGSMFGAGIGGSVKKFAGMPEPHSDFIFSVFGEEFGFLGVLFIILLFCLFAYAGYRIALEAKNRFERFVAFGLTSSIFFQALLNFGVVSGKMPTTGIPLPFFSHGGSSLIVSLIMVGLLLRIARNNREDADGA
jgi:cell division protein FtsW